MQVNPHWLCISFNLQDSFFGDVARRKTADLLDLTGGNKELSQRLFHYENGIAKDGFSPLKFQSRKNGFAILGYGEEMHVVMREMAGHIAIAWSASLRQPVTQSYASGLCSIEARPFSLRYVIPRLVIQKKPRHLEAFKKDPQAHASALIKRSIREQCNFLKIDCPDLNVKVLSWEGDVAAKLGHGTAALLTLKHVTIEINAMLSGWWSLGYLTGKGYGMLNADYAAAMRMESRYVAE